MLLAENKEKLIKQTHKLLEVAKRVGLEINVKKNKVHDSAEDNFAGGCTHHLKVGAYKFNRVQKFKYLGTLIMQNNEIQE